MLFVNIIACALGLWVVITPSDFLVKSGTSACKINCSLSWETFHQMFVLDNNCNRFLYVYIYFWINICRIYINWYSITEFRTEEWLILECIFTILLDIVLERNRYNLFGVDIVMIMIMIMPCFPFSASLVYLRHYGV